MPRDQPNFGGKDVTNACLKNSSSTVSVVSVTFAFRNFSFVPVMHQQQTTGSEWGIHCPFRNSDKQLLNLTGEAGYGLLSKATSSLL